MDFRRHSYRKQRRKLDGFQCRCLRRIVGILSLYWSRISNKDIRQRYGAIRFSFLLLEQQMIYFGKLFRSPESSLLRKLVFEGTSLELKKLHSKRRRGRPRSSWMNEVLYKGLALARNESNLISYLADEKAWKERVREFCRTQDPFQAV